MNSRPQEPEPSSNRERHSSGQPLAVSQADLNSVLDEFSRLVQVAADTGRDWKFVDALLRTIIDLVLQSRGDLFTEEEPRHAESGVTKKAKAPADETTAEPRLRLRPEYRIRIAAVIDSWSDDETADFLLIGLRQVRRRAQQGTLYYFVVNKKRRYPVWQFDGVCGVLDGVQQVARALPNSWAPERVYAFMTTRSPALKQVTPAQWLLLKRDLDLVFTAIEEAAVP